MKADRKNSLFDPNQIGLTRLFDRPRRREAAGGHNLVPLSQNRRLRAHVAGVCFASRTERPPPLASEATLGDEREANPGRYRPLTVLIGEKGKAAGFRMADGFAVCTASNKCS